MPNEGRKKEYSNLVKMYNIVTEQQKDLKEKSENIKEDIAKMMHEDSVNSVLSDVDGVIFKIAYQSRTTKKVDYNQLIEILGQNNYNEVVTQKESEFLSIRKAPKGEQTDILHKSPNGTKKTLEPPIGNLA